MRTRMFLATVFAAATGAASYLAAQAVGGLPPIPKGQIACQLSGQLNFDANRTARFALYLSSITGVPAASLFASSGERNERTAKLTVVSPPVRINLTRVGTVLQGLAAPVSTDFVRYVVYFNDTPANRDLARVETFENGLEVASFRARSVAVSAIPLLTAEGQGDIELESSRDFFLSGQRINFAELGKSVRVHFSGGPTPAGRSNAETLSFPVDGYGVATGAAAIR